MRGMLLLRARQVMQARQPAIVDPAGLLGISRARGGFGSRRYRSGDPGAGGGSGGSGGGAGGSGGSGGSGGGSGGAGGGSGDGGDDATRADAFLARYGNNARTAVAELLRDNRRAREKARRMATGGDEATRTALADAERERDDALREIDRVSRLLPAPGATVLVGDDAAAWREFSAIRTETKLTPAQVKEAIAERDTLKAKTLEQERAQAFDAGAKEAGFKGSTLAKVAKAEGLEIEMREISETVDGKTTKRSYPHVRRAGQKDATWERLDTFAERELTDFLPALKATEGDDAGGAGGYGNGTTGGGTTGAGGSGSGAGNGSGDSSGGTRRVPYVPQGSGAAGKSGARDVVGAHIQSRYSFPKRGGSSDTGKAGK